MAVMLACVVGLGACATQGGAAGGRKAASPEAYYPLAVGNRWTYAVRTLGTGDQHTVELVGERDGYFLDREGHPVGVDAFGVRDDKRYLLRGPVQEGTHWTNVVSVSSVEHYRVVAVGDPCSVPAGTFEDCVQVEARNRVDATTTLVNTLTFARDVGIVRVETVTEMEGRKVPQASLVLTSFALQPASP